MPADSHGLEGLQLELAAARAERDLLQSVMTLRGAEAARLRTRALTLADSVPATLRQHSREPAAFRVKMGRLATTLNELAQLLRELPSPVKHPLLDDAQQQLATLQTLPKATGDELIPIIAAIDTVLAAVRSACQYLPVAVEHQGGRGDQTAIQQLLMPQQAGACRLELALQQLAARLAREFRKELRFEAHGLELLPKEWNSALYEVCGELLRNAVEHGIETTAGRVAAGKDRTGRIELQITPQVGGFELSMRDDGRGLDVPAVFRSAIEAGAWPADDKLHDPRQAARLIFKPGVTTAAEPAGRGHGTGRVLTQLKALGARIRVSTESGSHLRLCADLPSAAGTEQRDQLVRA